MDENLFNDPIKPISRSFNFPLRRNRVHLPKFSLKKPSTPVLIIIGVTALVIIGLTLFIKNQSNRPSTISGQNTDQKFGLPAAKATQNINKEFIFPLKNDKGDEIGKIKLNIETAELRDEIIVKGQKATAVSGRTFLIFNLKVVNDFNQSVSINTRDYVRLLMNNNENEQLAPDIHNDPVEVQAISTKYTRLGFPINETDKNLKLRVGEIKGDKTTIDLNLR